MNSCVSTINTSNALPVTEHDEVFLVLKTNTSAHEEAVVIPSPNTSVAQDTMVTFWRQPNLTSPAPHPQSLQMSGVLFHQFFSLLSRKISQCPNNSGICSCGVDEVADGVEEQEGASQVMTQHERRRCTVDQWHHLNRSQKSTNGSQTCEVAKAKNIQSCHKPLLLRGFFSLKHQKHSFHF